MFPVPLAFLTLFIAQLAVQKYEELFPAFSDSRECKLMKVSADLARPDMGMKCAWMPGSQLG